MGTEEYTSSSPDVDKKEDSIRKLILYNDDYNTFDYIIQSLIEVCEHDELQAESCALIAHYKGKCHIKNGTINKLKPIHIEMSNRQITTEIN